MTVGDVIIGHIIVTSAGSMNIKPSGTTTWAIQNIYIPDGVSCELYRTDGSNDLLLYSITNSIQFAQPIHATSSVYFKVKNVSASSSYMGYDGRVTTV